MAATQIMVNETEIANAMASDEIELNRRLSKSLEQCKRGETLTMEELDKRVMEKFNNGYYLK
ncbi:MAG: hypothetical protein LBC87_12820 [Fibromonadaceae bacterium]|jgi:uncharacterized coiled-coil DUF342 family protein|nr:hypothetical protein [Fibromonadaceae bacterium]